MKRCGNAPKGSKQHRSSVSGGCAESSDVSSLLDECCGDGRGSDVGGRTDGAGGEKFSARKEYRNFSIQGKKLRRNDNGNFGYEQDRKSQSDVQGAVACGTKAIADEGEGIHAA